MNISTYIRIPLVLIIPLKTGITVNGRSRSKDHVRLSPTKGHSNEMKRFEDAIVVHYTPKHVVKPGTEDQKKHSLHEEQMKIP